MKQTELNNNLDNNNIKKLSDIELSLIAFLVQNKLLEVNFKDDDLKPNINIDKLESKNGAVFYWGIESGYIDSFRAKKFAINFSGIISHYSKDRNYEYWFNIADLYIKLFEIDIFFREELLKYVFPCEQNLEAFLFYIVMKSKIDNVNIDYDLLIKDLLKKEHKGKQSFQKNLILEMSMQIHSLSFYKKIEFLERLWKNNCFIIKDLSDRAFIHKDKITELRENILKKNLLASEKEINNFIFNIFKERLLLTKEYRNKISHFDELILDKKSVNNLYSYLIIQEDFLKNEIAEKFIFSIKKMLNKNEVIKNIANMRNHFSVFLFYKDK